MSMESVSTLFKIAQNAHGYDQEMPQSHTAEQLKAHRTNTYRKVNVIYECQLQMLTLEIITTF